MDKLFQPKMLYCEKCKTFSEPSYNLSCPVCGRKFTSCWWALLHGVNSTERYCKKCRNRYWCWTHRVGDERRLPSITQAQIINNAELENLCTWLDGKEGA